MSRRAAWRRWHLFQLDLEGKEVVGGGDWFSAGVLFESFLQEAVGVGQQSLYSRVPGSMKMRTGR